MSQTNEIPRTDICENCDREITYQLVSITGQHELIHKARKADERFHSVNAGKVKIQFSCRCSNVEVEYGPGSANVYEFPDEWMWHDDLQQEQQ